MQARVESCTASTGAQELITHADREKDGQGGACLAKDDLLEEVEADCVRAVGIQQLVRLQDVAQGLAHLHAVLGLQHTTAHLSNSAVYLQEWQIMVLAALIFQHRKTASNKGHVTELCLYSCRHSPRSPSCKILVRRYVHVKATAPMHPINFEARQSNLCLNGNSPVSILAINIADLSYYINHMTCACAHEEAVCEDLAGQRQAGGEEHAGPVEGVEAQNVLAHQVHVRRPAARRQLSLVRQNSLRQQRCSRQKNDISTENDTSQGTTSSQETALSQETTKHRCCDGVCPVAGWHRLMQLVWPWRFRL